MSTAGARAGSTNFTQLRQASRFWRSAGHGALRRAAVGVVTSVGVLFQEGSAAAALVASLLVSILCFNDLFDCDPPSSQLSGRL